MGNCIPSNTAAYPGNRRTANPIYRPSDDEYEQLNSTTAVANAHFETCPGGNALKLVGKPNRVEVPVGGEGLAKYISVTVPPGVEAGDTIHVKAPDGRMNAVTVPGGMGPGATFTVEFSGSGGAPPPAEEDDYSGPGAYVPTVVAEPEAETEVHYGGGGYGAAADGTGTSVARPTTGQYVPAYAV